MPPRGRRPRVPNTNEEDPIPARRIRIDTEIPASANNSNNPAPDFLSNEEIEAALQAEEQLSQRRRQIEEDQTMARQLQNGSPTIINPIPAPAAPAVLAPPAIVPVPLQPPVQPAITLQNPPIVPVVTSPEVLRFPVPIVPIGFSNAPRPPPPVAASTSAQANITAGQATFSSTANAPAEFINHMFTGINWPTFVNASTLVPSTTSSGQASSSTASASTNDFQQQTMRFSDIRNFIRPPPVPPTDFPGQSKATVPLKVVLATKPLPYDGTACSICFEEVPKDPVACQFCKKCIGCQECLLSWSKAASLPNHRQCPLCRYNWKTPKPKIVTMFISKNIQDANSATNSSISIKPKSAKKTPVRPKAKPKPKAKALVIVVEEPVQPIQIEVPSPVVHNTRATARRTRRNAE